MSEKKQLLEKLVYSCILLSQEMMLAVDKSFQEQKSKLEEG